MLYAAILLKLTSWLQSTNRPPPNFLLGGAAGMHWIRCNQNGRYVRNLRFSDDCKLRAESFFRIYPELLAKQANSKKEHDRACVRFWIFFHSLRSDFHLCRCQFLFFRRSRFRHVQSYLKMFLVKYFYLWERERKSTRIWFIYTGLCGDSLVQVCDMRFAHM